MIKGGKITEKSSFLPKEDMAEKKIAYILMWFVLPLVLLSIADRLWMWSTWFRNEESKHKNIFSKLLKKQKQENGKENRSRQLEDEQEPAGGRSSR
jgi:triosephosphate isomerase